MKKDLGIFEDVKLSYSESYIYLVGALDVILKDSANLYPSAESKLQVIEKLFNQHKDFLYSK